MSKQVSKDHHYVPIGLLKKWIVVENDQQVLRAFHWSNHTQEVQIDTNRGPKAYCYEEDLYSVEGLPAGKDAIERVHFGAIDDRGLPVLEYMVNGSKEFTRQQKLDFSVFASALITRRPSVVRRFRTEGADFLREQLDQDADLADTVKSLGEVHSKPSEVYERHSGFAMSDHSMEGLQHLTYNSRAVKRLRDCVWGVRSLIAADQEFILSDNPVIQRGSISGTSWCWFLPLSPKHIWFASSNDDILRTIESLSAGQLAKKVNVASALQCEKYVFAGKYPQDRWLIPKLREYFAKAKGNRIEP